ncbi:MAG: type II toxin-antitoxin system RelE/ParE family toxin [Ktedonobacterales bacterium]
MSYEVIVPKRVAKQILALPQHMYDRIRESLDALAQQPRPDGVKKLKGETNAYRVRVGNYRIVYVVDDGAQQVQVLDVDHRKDVYR